MFKFQNTYKDLPSHFFRETAPATVPTPTLIEFNKNFAKELGINFENLSVNELAQIFTGNQLLEGSNPMALAYAGHQFGHFSPQLGDGRAVLLGEFVSPKNKRYDLQLKGSGVTPFSRNGDGKSSLGPVIREYILSEAMNALGVPTTRALAAVLTGETVYREQPLPGAVFTRVASSHIRIGTFQYFAAKGDFEAVRTLADYSIDRHYPEIKNENDKYLLFINRVARAQISLISKWMSYGFIHGVMNTDNMSISGETLDYGPCAFMDDFNFHQVFSSIDHQGRYSYQNQGPIVFWNLSRLADCFIPFIHTDEKIAIKSLEEELEKLPSLLDKEINDKMKTKLGILNNTSDESDLIKSWLDFLQEDKLDFTLSFRNLSTLLLDDNQDSLFKESSKFKTFFSSWKTRIKDQPENIEKIAKSMNQVNPLYIPRNHQVEKAIRQAIEGDFSIFKELNLVLANPFQENIEFDKYKNPPRPEEIVTETFCGT